MQLTGQGVDFLLSYLMSSISEISDSVWGTQSYLKKIKSDRHIPMMTKTVSWMQKFRNSQITVRNSENKSNKEDSLMTR
jgi:hypothetical protein